MLYSVPLQSCHALPDGNVFGPQTINIFAFTYRRFISMKGEGMFSEMLASAIETLSKVLDPNGPAQAATAHSFTPTDFSVHFFLQLAIIILGCEPILSV